MVDLTRQVDPQVSFQPTGVKRFPVEEPVIPVDRSGAELVKDIGNIAEIGGELLDRQTLSNLQQQLQGEAEAGLDISTETPRREITPGDTEALNEVDATLNRLEELNRQIGKSLDSRMRIATTVASLRNKFPRLSTQIGQMASSRFGGVGGVISVQQDIEEQLISQRDALVQNIEEQSKIWNIPQFLPVEQQLLEQQRFRKNETVLQSLRQQNQIEEAKDTNTKVKQRRLLGQGVLPTAVNTEMSLANLRVGFDPKTATPDDIVALELKLNDMRDALILGLQDEATLFSVEELTQLYTVPLRMIEDTRAFLNGDIEQTALEDKIARDKLRAEERLARQPGFNEAMAAMKSLKEFATIINLVPSLSPLFLEMLETRLEELSPFLAKPFIVSPENENFGKILLNGFMSPDGSDHYNSLLAMEGQEAALQHTKNFSGLAILNLDNGPAANSLNTLLRKWTNGWTTIPEEVPVEIYDAILDVTAHPSYPKLREQVGTDARLSNNLIQGFSSSYNTQRNTLASELQEELSLGILPEGVPAFERVRGLGEAREIQLGRAVRLEVSEEGGLIFTPTEEFANSPRIIRRANELTRNHGVFFGKLAKSYAHIVEENTNYEAAANKLLELGSFRRLRETGLREVEPFTPPTRPFVPTPLERISPVTEPAGVERPLTGVTTPVEARPRIETEPVTPERIAEDVASPETRTRVEIVPVPTPGRSGTRFTSEELQTLKESISKLRNVEQFAGRTITTGENGDVIQFDEDAIPIAINGIRIP